jgi:hypothetical protein
MSTNLTDEMLPLNPRHAVFARQSPTESNSSSGADLVRQNVVSLAAFVAIAAIVVYLVSRTY